MLRGTRKLLTKAISPPECILDLSVYCRPTGLIAQAIVKKHITLHETLPSITRVYKNSQVGRHIQSPDLAILMHYAASPVCVFV